MKTYLVNGIRFRVKYLGLGRGRYRVIGPGRWFREYESIPHAHKDVLLAHLGEAGNAKRIDLRTANWPEEDIKVVTS